MRALDTGGGALAQASIDAEGRFAFPPPAASFQLEIAPFGAEVERIALDAGDGGVSVTRTYAQRYVDNELTVVFAATITLEEQEALLASEVGVQLLRVVSSDRYDVAVATHPALVGEDLDARHDEIIGYELVFLTCPHGA